MILAIVVTTVTAACSNGGGSGKDGAAGPSTAAYADHGPFAVGVTTLALADRKVEVFYPAKAGGQRGRARATYDQREPLPDRLKALVPDKFDIVTTLDAYRDLPGSTKGPFPVILFSHGLGGFRLDNSALEVGIASWGFVVAAPDHIERGRAALAGGGSVGGRHDGQKDVDVLLAALHLVEQEGATADHPLHGVVDGTKVGAVGHSAGGAAALTALARPEIAVAVGWAPAPPANGDRPGKPVLIIGGAIDSVITPAVVRGLYDKLAQPKRRVEIANAGHNGFTDSCVVIRRGGGLIEFARSIKIVPDELLALGENGCGPSTLEPQLGWRVMLHFTVAELRASFGIDRKPVGLGDAITKAFPGVTISYEHQP